MLKNPLKAGFDRLFLFVAAIGACTYGILTLSRYRQNRALARTARDLALENARQEKELADARVKEAESRASQIVKEADAKAEKEVQSGFARDLADYFSRAKRG